MSGPFFAEEAPTRRGAPEEPKVYPNAPGYRRRDTSKAAAEAITPRAGNLREHVLAQIKAKPGTADEVAARLGKTELAIRPRLTELTKQTPAKIVDTGERRFNASGRPAIVWRAAP